MRTARAMIGRWVVCSFAALSLSGCGTLFNPYVMPGSLKSAGMMGIAAPQAVKVAPSADDLPAAREEAYQYVRDLGMAASGHSELRNGTALVLIPLGAATLYKGMASDSANTKKLIAKLALTGAAIFGLSEQFYSAPRQGVYFEGMKTALCIIGTTDPYLIAKPEYDAFKGSLVTLDRAIARADAQVIATERLIPGAGDVAKGQARDFVAVARKTIRASAATGSAGIILRAQIDRAGIDLRRRIAKLSVEVAKQTQKTEPDLASIKATVASLADALKPPPQAPAASPKATAPAIGQEHGAQFQTDSAKAVAQTLQDEIDKLAAALDALIIATEPVASVVNSTAALVKVAGSSEGCTLDAVATTFKVEPSADRQEIAIPSTGSSTTPFVVSGGNGAIRATLAGSSQGDNVKVSASVKDGFYVAAVEVKSTATPGAVTLVIADNTQANHKAIDLELTSAKAATDKPKDTPDTTTKKDPPDQVTAKADVEAIQKGVGLTGKDIDGIAGDKTHAAVRVYKKKIGLPPWDGSLTKALLDQIRPPVTDLPKSGETPKK